MHDAIAALIVGRALCLGCIAAKVSVTLTAADEALTGIAKELQLYALPRSRCRSCEAITMTYRIGGRQFHGW